MLHLRYSAGLRISSNFRLYQSCEYTRALNARVLHKVLNKHVKIDCWQYYEYALDSEYARVLNMLGCNTVPNKILHIWQGSEYALSSEYASFTQGSVENGPSYPFQVLRNLFFKDLRCLEYLEFWIYVPRFWMYQRSKYVIPTKGSEQNTSSFTWKGSFTKRYTIDAWQLSEYLSGFE